MASAKPTCSCDGDETQYFDILDLVCKTKDPAKKYEIATKGGMERNCLEICSQFDNRFFDEEKINDKCPKKPLDEFTNKLFATIKKYTQIEINTNSSFITSLIDVSDIKISKEEKETILISGKAKICILDPDINDKLVHLFNLFVSPLYLLFFHEIKIDDRINFDSGLYKDDEYILVGFSNYTKDKTVDCAPGSMNLFYQDLESKYELDESIIFTEEEFKEILLKSIEKLHELAEDEIYGLPISDFQSRLSKNKYYKKYLKYKKKYLILKFRIN